ncbi:hypothetical protein Esti_004819 [Eimeria stiedai]
MKSLHQPSGRIAVLLEVRILKASIVVRSEIPIAQNRRALQLPPAWLNATVFVACVVGAELHEAAATYDKSLPDESLAYGMASAVSTNPFAMEAPPEAPACGANTSADAERSFELHRSAGSFESYDANGDGMRLEESSDGLQPVLQKPANPSTLLSGLDSVYFQQPEALATRPSRPHAASPSSPAAATGKEESVACVLWELEHLPSSGELMENVVARLEKLKVYGDEVNRSLCCRVAQRREELTKAASVLGQLRQALQKLRSESAAVRAGLSAFRQECVLPSLAITKQQQTKLALEREMQELLQIQRVEALLMAAENSCVNRELPLQAALLVEGAALSFAPQGSQAASSSQQDEPGESTHPSLQGGIKRMQQMLENLRAELNAALQAAARSLPPPPCSCGWRQPEPVSYSSRRGLQRLRPGSGVATTAAAGSAEGTWPQYYSALAAFSLLPPSSSVGASVAAAVAAAAAAATRQVLCAFVPADAAAFSEAESESFEAQRLCARLLFHDTQQPAAGAADAVAALPSAENLAASVAAADASACFMTLLGVQYDILLGATSLMRWHTAEALRLLAEVKAESSDYQEKRSQAGTSEAEMLELLGGGDARGGCTYTPAARARDRSDSDHSQCETHFVDTYALAASATQRLKGLPSSLRMALFLLQVRKQFLSQRCFLWQQLQQQTAQVLQHLDLGGGGSTAVSDCLSLMHAVRAFAVLGEAFVASENAEAEAALATEAAAAVAAVAATGAPADLRSPSFDAAADADSAAAAAIAADAAAAAATAAAAAATSGDAGGSVQRVPKEPVAGRLSQVLVTRVQEAIESLQETHTQELLQRVKAETWERLPVLRRFPLVLLRAPRQLGVLPQRLSEGMHPFAVAAEGCGVAAQAGRSKSVCGCCGEALPLSTVPNPFARWLPGTPFAGGELKAASQERGDNNASVELAAIEEELKAAKACGRGSDEPPVAVGASQAAAQCVMQYWQLAVCAPEVAVPAVKAMIRVVGFYLAAVAACALPDDICSCLATPLKHSFPSFGEARDKIKFAASADAAVLRNRLPHLHWLLCQTDEGLRASRKKLWRPRSSDGGSSNAGAANRTDRPALTELVRPMARLASPGALWGLAERVAAVESGRDLLEALTQQLHVQGLPQHFGSRVGTRVLRQQRGPETGKDYFSGLLRCLPREEQHQLWRLLAATRCAAEDLRVLVYRVAAGSLCQSSAFLASFHQAAAECSTDHVARNCSRAVGAPSSAANVVARAYAATVQQHRRQVADLFWKIRCAGSGSIPASVQPLIWRAVKSQAVADAVDALSAVPLAADAVERCLSPGPLVALAEALREIIAEAEGQYRKALAAAGCSRSAQQAAAAAAADRGSARAPRDGTTLERHRADEVCAPSPLDYSEADFDTFLDVCSRTAPEVVLWCREQQKRALSFQTEAGSKTLPLRVMPQMLQRLENAGLLPKGQTAEFENEQSVLLMQLMQPPPPPSS